MNWSGELKCVHASSHSEKIKARSFWTNNPLFTVAFMSASRVFKQFTKGPDVLILALKKF